MRFIRPTVNPKPDKIRESDQVSSRGHWLLLTAIVLHPIASLPAEVLFCIYIIRLALNGTWRERIGDRRQLMFAASILISAAWFASRITNPWGPGSHTFLDPYRHPVTVLDYVPFLIFFFFKSLQPSSLSEVRSTLWAIAAANVVHIPLAAAQKFLGWAVLWKYSLGGIPLIQLSVLNVSRGRITAGLGNGNVLGNSLLLSLVAISALLVWEIRRRKHSSETSRFQIAVLTVLGFCYLIVLVWTGSRNSWAVFCFFIIFFGLAVGIRLRNLLVPLAIAAILVTVAIKDIGKPTQLARSVVPKIMWGRLSGLPELRPSRLPWRLRVFDCATDMAQERPWVGWGIGAYAPEAERRLRHIVNHTHNIFLQLATENGIPFTIFFSALFGTIFVISARKIHLSTDSSQKALYSGPLFIVAVCVMSSQISLAIMHSNHQEIIFWWSLATCYSLSVRPPRHLERETRWIAPAGR